jgi:hypothetical protein
MGKVPVSTIKQDIAGLLEQVSDSGDLIPPSILNKIRDALKPHLGWRKAKSSGLAILDPGGPAAAGKRLLAQLSEIDLLIVPSGELESFDRNESAEKNEWVNHTLEKYRDLLAISPEMHAAREFVSGMLKVAG